MSPGSSGPYRSDPNSNYDLSNYDLSAQLRSLVITNWLILLMNFFQVSRGPDDFGQSGGLFRSAHQFQIWPENDCIFLGLNGRRWTFRSAVEPTRSEKQAILSRKERCPL